MTPPDTEIFGFNPFAPGFYDDPYPHYARLRGTDPIHRTEVGPWVITRWSDVHAVLRLPHTSVDENRLAERRANRDELARRAGRSEARRSRAILNIDPPDHTRLRRLMAKAFTPRSVERIRARTGELVDETLDRWARGDGRVDLIEDLAFPLPFTVITEMLGMPDGDRDHLRQLSHTVTRFLDPLLLADDPRSVFDATDAMHEIVTEAIAWKRTRHDDDLLTALIRAEVDGDVLSDAELVENVTLLYLAGHETTVNLIGNGVHALLEHRDQLERLAADPDLDANAVEELLRYDSPVQFSRRILLEATEIDGVTIPAESLVMTGLGAANHDPDKFGPDAHDLDLARPTAREHVSFGSGVHHCLGAALARLEGQEAIGRLVRRFPDMEAAGTPTHNGRMVLRGYDHLPLALGPART